LKDEKDMKLREEYLATLEEVCEKLNESIKISKKLKTIKKQDRMDNIKKQLFEILEDVAIQLMKIKINYSLICRLAKEISDCVEEFNKLEKDLVKILDILKYKEKMWTTLILTQKT